MTKKNQKSIESQFTPQDWREFREDLHQMIEERLPIDPNSSDIKAVLIQYLMAQTFSYGMKLKGFMGEDSPSPRDTLQQISSKVKLGYTKAWWEEYSSCYHDYHWYEKTTHLVIQQLDGPSLKNRTSKETLTQIKRAVFEYWVVAWPEYILKFTEIHSRLLGDSTVDDRPFKECVLNNCTDKGLSPQTAETLTSWVLMCIKLSLKAEG